MKPNPTPSLAYSYIRFSTPEQARGDSLRRQTEAAKVWCERNGACLDTSLTLRDLGKSAYLGEHRKNADRFALAAFLKLVEEGHIARGSYLIIESLDRLTREHVRAGLMLCLGMIEAGIRIVQLSPSELVYDEKSDEMALMLMVVELARGHRESKRKSDLIGAAWVEKRRRAREGVNQPPRRKDGRVTRSLTDRLPAWVEEVGGKLRLIPEKVAGLRRVYELAAGGYGCTLILRKVNEEQVPAVAPSGRWTRSYIGQLLNDKRVLGEFQPRLRDRTPDGSPIPNYYPRAIEDKLWLDARAGAQERHDKPGRTGTRQLNVFANLLTDARSGAPYIAITRLSPGGAEVRARMEEPKRYRVLVVGGSVDGTTPAWAFPYDDFQAAFIDYLRELDWRDVLEPQDEDGEVVTLAAQLAATEAKIGELEIELLQGDVTAVVKVLRKLEATKKDQVAQLTAARQRAANPIAEGWIECQSLLATIKQSADPERAYLRLRSVLRRLVEEIRLLVVRRGRDRLAAVQVQFCGTDQCRGYVILNQGARSNKTVRRPAQSWVWTSADVADLGKTDLRKLAHARRLEAALKARDLEALIESGTGRALSLP